MSQPISTLMQREVHAVGMDDTIAATQALFTEKRLSWAPVLDPDGAAIGVVSSTDLLKFHVQGRDPGAVPTWQLCSYRPLAVDLHTPVQDVARQMVDQHVHHVVVTDGPRLAGIVSSLDFVREFARR